jgi:hypothetical protein
MVTDVTPPGTVKVFAPGVSKFRGLTCGATEAIVIPAPMVIPGPIIVGIFYPCYNPYLLFTAL